MAEVLADVLDHKGNGEESEAWVLGVGQFGWHISGILSMRELILLSPCVCPMYGQSKR